MLIDFSIQRKIYFWINGSLMVLERDFGAFFWCLLAKFDIERE